MWKYIKQYLPYTLLAALFMVGEVSMDLVQPGIMSKIVDDGVLGLNSGGHGSMELIFSNGLKMLCFVLFGALCGILNNVFVHISGQSIGNSMRKDCFRNIMSFSFPQLDGFGTGSLITRVTNDITQVQSFASQLVQGVVRTALLMFGSIFCMFKLDRDFGLIVLCAFPLITGCLLFCMFKANPLFYKLQQQLDELNAIMQEDISGIRTIKAYIREIYEKRRFGKANDSLVKTQLRVLLIFAMMNPTIHSLLYIVITAILLVGSADVSRGIATPGTIMAAITYATQLLTGILMLVMLFQNISRGIASWKRIREVLNSKSGLTDGSFAGETEAKGEIEFSGVSFSYPGSTHTVLRDISLKVRPGETLAVMGATGCGKTTLINLIPRFYDTTSGRVLVDGIDVRDYSQRVLRDKIAFVLQKTELFCASAEENIRWGCPTASEEDIRAAAAAAQADGFISALPDGYDTLIAERGASLSGGQKQRVSIARAIVKSAEIIIFDDSTSALDLKTEAELYSALKNASPHSTKIIVAQRIASVRRADRIAVIENGSISACGTHDELMQACQAYRDIYNSQLGEEAQA